MKLIKTLSLTAPVLAVAAAWADGTDTPVEFGAVAWEHELEPALARANTSGKPIMLLFQEVPG